MSREQDILDAAIKVFAQKGFSAATTSEIAKQAGVAEGTIFRYFKTKKDILNHVMIQLIEVMSDELVTKQVGKLINENKDKDPSCLLKLLFKDRIEVISKHIDLIKIVLTEMQYHPDLKNAFFMNFAVKGKDLMGQFFNENIENGVFKNIDPLILTRSFVGMVAMFIIQKQMAP